MLGAMSVDSGALRKIPYILSDVRRQFVTGVVKLFFAVVAPAFKLIDRIA